MAENAPVMIWIADTEKNRHYFNKAWLDFRGRSLEEERGDGWLAGIHPEDLDRSVHIFEEAFSRRMPYKKEFRLRRKDGAYRWILTHGAPILNDNHFEGYIGSCMDINYRVEQEQQKDEFMAIASHELKTPLTSIKIYTELLYQNLFHDQNMETAQMVLKIGNQVDRLTWLIKEMLDVTRISTGSLRMAREYFDLSSLAEDVAEEMQNTMESHRIQASIQPHMQVWGDKGRLRQVLVNLISNAIKYSPESRQVDLRAWAVSDGVTVSVHDTGIGIPEKLKTKIFDRFFRATTQDNNFPGFGLGLYICSEITRHHKGKIWFESKPGDTTFFLFVPFLSAGGQIKRS
jgi:PAS domain S-box-containing protein